MACRLLRRRSPGARPRRPQESAQAGLFTRVLTSNPNLKLGRGISSFCARECRQRWNNAGTRSAARPNAVSFAACPPPYSPLARSRLHMDMRNLVPSSSRHSHSPDSRRRRSSRSRPGLSSPSPCPDNHLKPGWAPCSTRATALVEGARPTAAPLDVWEARGEARGPLPQRPPREASALAATAL